VFNSIQVTNYWFTLHRALGPLYQQAQTSSPNIRGISDQDVTLLKNIILLREVCYYEFLNNALRTKSVFKIKVFVFIISTKTLLTERFRR